MITSSGFHRVNGLKLWVHRFREEGVAPSGLTIVLLHGFMDTGATWDLVAPALTRAGHDVLAPDLRGFGLSDNIGAGGYYHFPDYVADLAELVEGLAPRRLALVGHSMGGTIAALFAGTFPDRVERLALLEGTGPAATGPALAVDRMQAWLRTLREVSRTPKPLTSMQEVVERLCLHHPRVARELIESRARLLTRMDDSGRLVWAYDPLHRTTAPTPFQVEAFKEFLRRIDCPTLVVTGGPSGWRPPDESERVACLRYAWHFELPTAGHMMHWTEPGPLSSRLAQFLGEPAPAKNARAASAQPSIREASAASWYGEAMVPSAGMATSPSPPAAATAPAMNPPGAVTVTMSPPGVTVPGKPVYAGAAADIGQGSSVPVAGSVPVGPTRPSSGTGGT